MGEITNKQLAARLTELVNQLNQSGDFVAETSVCEAVESLERAIGSEKREFRQSAKTPNADEGFKIRFSMRLSEVVDKIKTTTRLGRPLSEQFRGDVTQHERTKCIATVVFEDTWKGEGRRSPDKFWDMVVFVWRNAPDFFEEYDSDRKIIEESEQWTQPYFDKQRNFLRHNFCLKRLCHLVMVYDYLYGAEAIGKKTSTESLPKLSPNYPIPEKSSHSSRSTKNLLSIIAIVFLSIAALICLVGRHADKVCSKTPQEHSSGSDTNRSQIGPITMGETTNNMIETLNHTEVSKPGHQRNEVARSQIASQEIEP